MEVIIKEMRGLSTMHMSTAAGTFTFRDIQYGVWVRTTKHDNMDTIRDNLERAKESFVEGICRQQ